MQQLKSTLKLRMTEIIKHMKKEKYMDTSKIKLVGKKFKFVVGDSIGTPTGRIVFPWLTKPQPGMVDEETGKEGPAKYNVQLLIPKDGKFTKAFEKTLHSYVQKMTALFNKGQSTTINVTSPFRDGNAKGADKGDYWKGNWYIVAKNAEQPCIVSTKKVGSGWEEIDPATLQGGMLVRLVVSPAITKTGLSYKLLYVQLVQDDKVRFGGGFDKKVMGGLLKGDAFDESTDEVTAEDAADELLGNPEEEPDADEEGQEDADMDEDGNGVDDEDEDDEEEEEEPAPKRRGRPPGSVRKGKGALIDRL